MMPALAWMHVGLHAIQYKETPYLAVFGPEMRFQDGVFWDVVGLKTSFREHNMDCMR